MQKRSTSCLRLLDLTVGDKLVCYLNFASLVLHWSEEKKHVQNDCAFAAVSDLQKCLAVTVRKGQDCNRLIFALSKQSIIRQFINCNLLQFIIVILWCK